MFEIHVGELRATFLRNYNMRRHIDPKRKTAQAEDNPRPEDAHIPGNHHNCQKHRGTAPDKGHCTRYVAVHPLRGGAPEQKRWIAYGSGALPQHTRKNAELAHRTTHRRTPPCAAGPYWRQDGHAAHAATCTPAHSNTSHTLTCEEPANHILTEQCSIFHTGIKCEAAACRCASATDHHDLASEPR